MFGPIKIPTLGITRDSSNRPIYREPLPRPLSVFPWSPSTIMTPRITFSPSPNRIPHSPTTLIRHLQHLQHLRRSFSLNIISYLWSIILVLGNLISEDGVLPNDDRVASLSGIPRPSDFKQLRSLFGGLSYYSTLLPNMARRIHPITAFL